MKQHISTKENTLYITDHSHSHSSSDTLNGDRDAMRAMVDEATGQEKLAEVKVVTDQVNRLKNELKLMRSAGDGGTDQAGTKRRRAVNVSTGTVALQLEEAAAYQSLATPLERRRNKYLQNKKEYGNRQDETLTKLNMFTKKIKSEKTPLVLQTNANERNKQVTQNNQEPDFYHGQILENDDSDEDQDGVKWHNGKLKFKRHIDDKYRQKLAGDGRRGDDYVVLDPREVKH